MNNRPILFVNTISMSENGKENQMIYDSRRIQKSRIMHRIDDIVAFKYLYKNVFIYVVFDLSTIEGEFYSIDSYFIYLKQKYEIVKININSIKDIQITSFL